MNRMKTALVGTVALLCGACTFETSGSDERPSELTQAMDTGTPGTLTGLVARVRRNRGNICSGGFLPFTDPSSSSSPDSTWVITANHCIDQDNQPTISSEYSVVTNTGQVVQVDGHYFHPFSERDFENLPTSTLPLGRVDMVLLHLAEPAHLPANSKRMLFELSNSAPFNGLFLESADLQGTGWIANYQKGRGTPSTTYLSRMGIDFDVDDGDSGGLAYMNFDLNVWFNQGLVSSFGNDFTLTHSSFYREWVMDVINCKRRPFSVTEPTQDYCSTTCKCGPGEGDCDSDSECESGLTCQPNAGDKVGLPTRYDICLEPGRQSSNSSGYCESIGGCQIYEGDCNSNTDCLGNLVCRENIGYAVGLKDSVDVCDLPRQPNGLRFNRNGGSTRDNASGRCTVDNPCGLGDGDCDSSNHDTCRGYLKCKANVGTHFGFTEPSVDVCVHPDYY